MGVHDVFRSRRAGVGGWVLGVLWWWLGAGAGAAPFISEFMAANVSGLLDEDRETSEWIEIENPDLAPFDLSGCFLTDTATRPNRWMFPAVSIPAHGRIVVFASGKNRRNPAGPWHTNFRLDGDGEYLALIAPDGKSVLDAFAPTFPRQYPDVSFGRPSTGGTRDLLAGARLRTKVATRTNPLEIDWYQADLAPGAGWQEGARFGVGFDTGFSTNGGTNLARRGTATQSSTLGAFAAARAIDGDPATFTHTAGTDNRSTWTVDLGRDWEVSRILLRNRGDCCQSRFRDLLVSLLAADGKTVAWKSALLNPENALGGPATLEINLFDLNVGPVVARQVRVERVPDPDLSGAGGQGNGDEAGVLSLGEVEVYGAEGFGFGDLVRTDLGASMRGLASTVGIRAAFDVSGARPTGALRLRMRYDDGFVAYLNGQRIAEANAPAALDAGAVATRERADTNAVQYVDFPVPASLLRDGENVLAILGLNVSVTDDDLLIEARLEDESGALPGGVYFDRATPGAVNDSTWYLGRLKPPDFSARRGFVEQPFDLTLTGEDPAARLVYTLDGSEPTADHGTTYVGPLRIDRTRVVRARAVRTDFRASSVASHTFVFTADVARQPVAPAGFPAKWADVTADYEMDPAIARAPAFAGRMDAALRAIPSVSFSTENDNLFGASRGIYANPESRGISWERPVSMEWLDPAGGKGFHADAGLRIQGGYFRQRGVTQKHSLRVVFKDEYGTGRLKEDLFGEFGAAREFDTLVFRAGANDGYAWGDARDTEQFLRDEFGRRTARAMGLTVPHGRFVHVYLNGLYWGLYNLAERPNEDFSATYFGGAPEEWDSINSGEIKSGDLNAWNQLLAGVRTATNAVAYLKMQGLDANGVRAAALPVLFDPPNYIDYMMVNLWGGNWDWPNKNFWFGRKRTADSTGFKFYLWDFENTMGNNRGRSPLNMVSPRADIASSWVGEPHARLKANAEYRLQFADRVQRHFFGNGPLTAASLVARYRGLAEGLATPVIAETARWGDDNLEPPQDLTDWERERDWLLNVYLPQRSAVVLGQLRANGLFPAVETPEIRVPAGSLMAATLVVLATPARYLCYTFDGTDPRSPGGAPNPSAQRADFGAGTGTGGASENPNLVAMDAAWRYWDKGTDPGAGWNQPSFVDAAWPAGPAELGYGDGDEQTVTGYIDADPSLAGVQRNAATYFRSTFVVPDVTAWSALSLEVRFDDAAAVYLNGQEILRTANLPAGADYRTYATADSPDNSVETRSNLPVTLLRPGTNWITAEVHQRNATSSDVTFALALTATPRGGVGAGSNWHLAPTFQARAPLRVLARSWTGTDWSALLDVRLSPDTLAAASSNLVVSELLFRPAAPGTPAELMAATDAEEFEFVELMNVAERSVDLSGVRLAGGVQFEFPPGTTLTAGARRVVVANRLAFEARYGAGAMPFVAGEYSARLANEGEIIRLETAEGVVLHAIHYQPGPPWPALAMGHHQGLVLVHPDPASRPGEPSAWRLSRTMLGTPGGSDAVHFTGNPAADRDGNGWPDVIDYALGQGGSRGLEIRLEPGDLVGALRTTLRLAYVADPAAEDVALDIQWAPSPIGPWVSTEPQLQSAGVSVDGNGLARFEFRLGDGATAGARYFRLVVGLR